MPSTSQPRLQAESTAARITALSPGASPPPVDNAILIISRFRFQEGNNFAWLGMSAELGFLEDGLSIRDHFEAPTSRRDHLQFRLRKTLSNLCRQTGGTGFVVSDDAVFDADFHRWLGCYWLLDG